MNPIASTTFACIALTLLVACGDRKTAQAAAAQGTETAVSVDSSLITEGTVDSSADDGAMGTESGLADDGNATRTAVEDPSAGESVAAVETPSATAPLVESGNEPAAAVAPPTPEPVAAVDEKAILKDKDGQWAAFAEASSTYGDGTAKGLYSAWQAIGAPNVPQYSDHPSAWATRNGDAKLPEWLQLGFATPVHATSIRIRQNTGPGAIARIELLDAEGAAHVVWEGTDATVYPKNTIGWMVRDFDATGYLAKGARITLATNRVWGWNEIDAVQLVGKK